MKVINSFKMCYPVLFGILMMLVSCSSSVSKKNPGSPSEIQINYRSPLNVWLKIPEVSKTLSEANTPIRGGYFAWIGNASLRWEVDVPEDDEYEVYLTANVTGTGDGEKITIEAGGKQADFTIFKTSGPFPGGENFKIKEALNFERKKLSGAIPLKAGKQVITVSTSGIETEEVLFHLRGIELLPVSKREFIAAEEARAIRARASFDWMAETGYGLMFHWTSRTPQADGSRKSFAEAVNDFEGEASGWGFRNPHYPLAGFPGVFGGGGLFRCGLLGRRLLVEEVVIEIAGTATDLPRRLFDQ